MTHNRKFTAAIFDLDGTIVDNVRYHLLAWSIFFNKYLKDNTVNPIDINSMIQFISGKKTETVIRNAFASNPMPKNISELVAEKEEIYRTIYIDFIKARPGLSDFLYLLSQKGVKLGIASSGTIENIELVIDRLEIRHFFDAIVSGEQVQHSKPDPEIFMNCAEKLNASPRECIVFEDSPSGLLASENAQMLTIIIGQDVPMAKNSSNVLAIVDDYNNDVLVDLIRRIF